MSWCTTVCVTTSSPYSHGICSRTSKHHVSNNDNYIDTHKGIMDNMATETEIDIILEMAHDGVFEMLENENEDTEI